MTSDNIIFDGTDPQWYLNRELTWLAFNQRVLAEGQNPRTPLLERLKFLAIVSSNLDEFFMKRIGGLKQQQGAGVKQLTVDGRTPSQQISACYEQVRALESQKVSLLHQLTDLLAEQAIHIVNYRQLDQSQRQRLRRHYLENIFPLVTPQAIDPAHPFPFISNLSLNILAAVRHCDDEQSGLVRIKVPVNSVSRFIEVETDRCFVPLEDVIANNLDLLFPDMVVESWEVFRVTRNAITENQKDSGANDLLALIESELRERKFAPIVRLEVQAGMTPSHQGLLASELGLDEDQDVFAVHTMLAQRDLMQIAMLDRHELRDNPHAPLDHPILSNARNLFHAIRGQGPFLLQHPYESFSNSVERFLKQASVDPKVMAIKMTLYRTSARSKIIKYLIDAAQNGKQVAVVVELKARFDESANIQWANRLEEAGIHVSYGVIGLKTHSKVIFVVRRDYDGLRRYAHIGTGNYHAGTARLYSDLGYLTADPVIGQDLTEFFNYLTTGYGADRQYQKLLPAPNHLKPALLAAIDQEIIHHQNNQQGLIRFKMNALEDRDITEALYRASQAGVTVQLIIRDTCRLRPGIAGISDHVQVISIVGRFLEHTRIFSFANDGHPLYWIGSADCMKRNLESRVEMVVPIEEPALQALLDDMWQRQWQDQRSAWDMQPNGDYIQRQPDSEAQLSSQQQLIDQAQTRLQSYLEHTAPKRRRLRRFFSWDD